ncbi:MAG: rod shape-determining protein MreC [Bacteroidaceae bacterium]|jgi:rod shape-determining protein MreC|nr:rod shape-determining protein MreC [Bacteroidaceae bacterium]
MRSLLDYLVKYSYVFLFILLEILSLVLLFGFNDRQKLAFVTSANSVSGSIYELFSNVDVYFNLRRENTLLVEENARLRSMLYELTDSQTVDSARNMSRDGVIAARVIDNSVRKDDNYMTVNKGSNDGVGKGMGVYNSTGVIGVIMASGKSYSVVMPILNGNTSISSKIKGTDNFGFLEWSGGDPYTAQLKDVPYHSNVEVGDTVVTTGFSSVFPENITIGTVADVQRLSNGYTLKILVSLAVDMSDLGWVYIHSKTVDPEIIDLQQQLK